MINGRTSRVALLDYGAGNVASVVKALRHVGATVQVTAEARELSLADAIVVPGVGHFDRTAAIDEPLRRAVRDAADRRRVPVLGICLGLHWLFDGSEESARAAGLGLVGGRCRALPGSADVKVPHIGWNALQRTGGPSRLLEGIEGDAYVYFCHSYAPPKSPETTAVSWHGVEFSAVVERDTVFGVQFHPEKSGRVGLRILENFLSACGGGR